MRGPVFQMAAALVALFVATSAQACPVCIDLPEATLSDRLLEADVAVLARENPDTPFRFEVLEVVRGNAARLRELPDIPYLLSSTNRRILAAHDQSTILLSYGPLPQLEDGLAPTRIGWNKLGLITVDRRALIDRIILEGEDWAPRATAEPARFTFFADLLTHPDKQVRDMALAEISRAPYRLIRSLADPVPTGDLLKRINQRSEIPFAPVAVLLLGLNTDDAARARVRAGFASAVQHGSYIAGAWAVAAIEVDRDLALARIGQRLADANVMADLRSDLVLALTVSGSALPELRPEIADILKAEARRSPEELGTIVLALYEWKDWSLYDHIRTVLTDDGLPDATRYVLDAFVHGAQEEFLAGMGGGTPGQKPDTLSMNQTVDTTPMK